MLLHLQIARKKLSLNFAKQARKSVSHMKLLSFLVVFLAATIIAACPFLRKLKENGFFDVHSDLTNAFSLNRGAHTTAS